MRERNINICALKFLAFIFLFSVMLALSSCSDDGIAGEGITVEPRPQYSYSEESLEYAEELLYSILWEAETERLGELGQSKIAELNAAAGNISEILANGMISEERYLSLIRTAYGERKTIAGVLCGRLPLFRAEPVWRALISEAGRDYASDILFEILLLDFENKRQAALDEYESGEAGYQLALAERYTKNIAALKEGVGRENLALLLDYAFMICELILDPSFDGGGISLTDDEVLMLINHLDPAELSLSSEGWELALTLPADAVLNMEEPDLLWKMYFAAAKNGDAARIAGQMPDVISLICSVRSGLTADTVADIRAGDGAAALTDIVNGFDAEDFDRLDRILSTELQNVEYSTLAYGCYGAAYEEYLASLRTYTKEELIQSKNTDLLYETLKGYIAGRCPALSYAIFYEK